MHSKPMRRLIAPLGLAAVLSAGAIVGSVAAASGSDPTGCSAPTTTGTTTSGTTSQTATTQPTTTASTSTTAPATTTTASSNAPAGHPLNDVTVENCVDGTKQARAKLQATPVRGGADPENLAFAYAHDCATGCQAVAVAFQVVLVNQGAQVQSPQNAAVAVNQRCTGCGAFAYADQYALDVPAGTTLSPATHRAIAQVRREAVADVNANLDFATLDSRLRALAQRLQTAVDDGLRTKHIRATRRHSTQRVKQSGSA